MTWVAFVISSFAMAGVIVVVADKTTCGGAPPVPLVSAKRVVVPPPENMLQKAQIPVQQDSEPVHCNGVETGCTKEDLNFKVQLLQDYVNILSHAQDNGTDWPKYALYGQGYDAEFVYPPLPDAAGKDDRPSGTNVDLFYSGKGIYRMSFADVSTSTDVGLTCDKKKVFNGNEFCVSAEDIGGMNMAYPVTHYWRAWKTKDGFEVFYFSFFSLGLNRHCETDSSCLVDNDTSKEFERIVNKVMSSVKISENEF